MSEPFTTYLQEYQEKLNSGVAREHAYRPSLETLLKTLSPTSTIINDPARIACGAPDYILLRDGFPFGYVEAKDLGAELGEAAESDQLRRYRNSLGNLILTNYLDFYWYVQGELRGEASLGRKQGKGIKADKEGPTAVNSLLTQFFQQESEPIATAEELAERMAHLALLIKEAIDKTLELDGEKGIFHAQLQAFQKVLLPTLKPAEFADMYAQTLTYGLFAARVRSADVGGEISRDNMHSYLPSTNPFLADFFYQISGRNMPQTVSWLVDDLAKLLRRANIEQILRQFGQRTRQEDPLIHFYETFLQAYDPDLREKRGVYYTPEPVVSYIVRSVEAILQTRFNRPLGLADPQTLILDPAVGTGTFLYFVIQQIYDKLHSLGQAGSWSSYVQNNLLPRLFGFELLMAPYAVAHLKLGVLLRELGYTFAHNERLNIFLTNTLSEPLTSHEVLPFADFLSQEGSKASEIKRDKPIMVVLGNPPYSGHSANKSRDDHRKLNFIGKLVDEYYFADGERISRTEKNTKWLQDDYVKFIRWAQWRIEQTGQGVVAFVTNHGFLDNPTFRGMRQQLLQAFDEIYIINLHGNSKKKETAPDGGKEENVFDIQQGVAITLLVKTSLSKAPAKVSHIDLWGIRQNKYQHLLEKSLTTDVWTSLTPQSKFYFLKQLNITLLDEYESYEQLNNLFLTTLLGPNSHRDHFAITFNESEAQQRINDLGNLNLSNELLQEKYELKDNRDWSLSEARKTYLALAKPVYCLYRLFDFRFMLYGSYAFDYHRPEVNDHLLAPHRNLALIYTRQTKEAFAIFATQHPVGQHKLVASYDGSYISPLYKYNFPKSTSGTIFAISVATRQPNLAPEFIQLAEGRLGLTLAVPTELEIQPPTPAGASTFTPEDIFYYAYAIFHCPTYRTRYAEFLKIDFPRLPLTSDVALFRHLAHLGHQLVQLHLLSSPAVHQLQTSFPQAGHNQVEKGHPRYVEPTAGQDGRVYINQTQYFAGISPTLWEMQIGGYQPLQKWLKDRVGRALSFEELYHYQQVVVALADTQRLMQEIDAVIPGWPLA